MLKKCTFKINKPKLTTMKILYFLFLITWISIPMHAQIKSGSFKLDSELNSINVSARADFGKFKAEMGVNYNISEQRIEHFHAELHMEPAEIYFALEMSRISGRPVDDVIEIYKKNKGLGWGEIAKQMGIKPGSPEFHQLKNSVKNKSVKEKSKGGKSNKGEKEKKGKNKKNN